MCKKTIGFVVILAVEPETWCLWATACFMLPVCTLGLTIQTTTSEGHESRLNSQLSKHGGVPYKMIVGPNVALPSALITSSRGATLMQSCVSCRRS